MPDIEKVVGFLQALGRIDLVSLLRFSKYHLLEVDVWGDITVPGAKVLSRPCSLRPSWACPGRINGASRKQ